MGAAATDVVPPAIVVVLAATVDVAAALVEVVWGGSVSGAGEQATTKAVSTSGRSLDAVIGSNTQYEAQKTGTSTSWPARKLV